MCTFFTSYVFYVMEYYSGSGVVLEVECGIGPFSEKLNVVVENLNLNTPSPLSISSRLS